MIGSIEEYYRKCGIWPTDFRCRSRESCAAGCPEFTDAKVSFVGPKYEEGVLPRLLFLSLDSGSGRADPQERTAEAVRSRELARDVGQLRKNPHWYRTHEMAYRLLHRFKPDLQVTGMAPYFAHVNSAKCCQNNEGRKQAARRMFVNCRPYISPANCVFCVPM